ncbi:peroxidase 5-like [Dorcoceras hygrometricum]|uniref:Peroxidase n=1 Tax=Dorcoceras hygrometricum TaxID=472368 RepID=A0A2Z7C230_9LAMI|nr:peroxidase 5-like [Dorcoceras hygrometricum]
MELYRMLQKVLFLVLLFLGSQVEAQLRVDFYNETCSNAEAIIWEEVKRAFFRDRGIAPGLVRMHFHDCFVRGCDGSVLIKTTVGNNAEEDGPPNAGTLRGFEVIDSAKTRLEQECRGVVSCADILAYAARDSVVITGGLGWDVPAGRRDGRISRAEETIDIPAPFFNLDQLTQAFARKHLTQDDMIALSGAHTIGRAHCTSFSDRLYNFRSTNGPDPALHPLYAFILRRQCPRNPQGTVDLSRVVQMNLSPATLENSYYADLLRKRGLFTSDQALTTSPESLSEVQDYAMSNRKWLHDFADAMIKMSEIEVLTGNAGEIREKCQIALQTSRRVNTHPPVPDGRAPDVVVAFG